MINVYLSNYSSNFGYLDIILLGMIRFYNLATKEHIRQKTGHESKFSGFTEKEFNIPKNESKPIKQDLS